MYNLTRVDLNSFTFSAGSKSRCIDNAVLGHLPKRLLFTTIKNADFNGSVDTSPYKFRHYDISEFLLYLNVKRVPSEGLTLDMVYEKVLLWSLGPCLKCAAYVTRTRDYR